MANKTKEFRKLVISILEDDLGMEVVEFGVRGGGHPYVTAEKNGETYHFTFSSSHGKYGRAGLRSDFKKRIHN